jgi:hypothetical protein
LQIVEVFRGAYPQAAVPTHAAPRSGDIIHSRGAADAAEAALGFRAEVPVETGLQELIRGG